MKQKTNPFIETRLHHERETAEDYTELIADLIDQEGEARTCELAKHLGVSHVTVIRVLKRLQKEGYVITDTHKPITLTEKGRELGKFSKQRHEILLEYLVRLGVPKNVAEVDVEGMEHHISSQTLNAIQQHLATLPA